MAVNTRGWLVVGWASTAYFLLGGTFQSYGVVILSLTRELDVTTAFVGTIFGLSIGLMYILSISYSTVTFHVVTCSADYFPRAFKMACGCVMTWAGIGYIVGPICVEWFHNEYGWRGSLLMLGALNLHSVVFGALMKPVKRCNKQRSGSVQLTQQPVDGDERCNADLEPEDKEEMELDEGNIYQVEKGSTGDIEHGLGINLNMDDKVGEKGAITPERTIPGEGTDKVPMQMRITQSCACLKPLICRSLKTILQEFDLYLYRDFPKIIISISFLTIITGISHNVVLFVTPNGQAKGFSLDKAVYLSTISCIGGIMGRFSSGVVPARNWIKTETYILVITFLGGVACILNTVANSFWFLAILSGVKGFAVGVEVSIFMIFIQENLPPGRFKAALTICHNLVGIGYPLGGAILGSIFDLSGSYNVSFCIAGVTEIIAGASVKLPFLVCKGKQHSNEEGLEPPEKHKRPEPNDFKTNV